MDIFRNLFFAYVATVVAFVSPLVPTTMRAKVKVPMANDLRNVSATASGSATIVDDANLIGDAKRVIIDDGAFIGVPTPIVISDPPQVLPCVESPILQTTTASQVASGANPPPCPQQSTTPTPTAPPDCYYEQMNCIQGGPIGSVPKDCPAKLICKATGAPVPSVVPPGCYAMQICDEFPIGDVQPLSASSGVAQGQSGPFVGPKCRTEVICGKGTPTTVPSVTIKPTESPKPSIVISKLPVTTIAPVVTPSCTPKPACIDATDSVRCMMPEPRGGWCATKPPVKITISPLPVVTLPPGCKYVEACKPGVYDQGDWNLKEITMQAAKSHVTSGNSCYTSVQCIEPTKPLQPTPTAPVNGCFTIDVCYGQDSPAVDRTWGSGFLPESGVPICKQQVVCPSPTAKPLPTATPVKATPIPSPQASCAPSVGVCGFNLNSAWAGASDITCQIPNSGKHGDIVTLSPYPSVCMGGYDTGTYKDAGKGQAQVKCENGKWKTFHPYYFWTYPGWNGCGTPVTGTLGSKSIILPIVTVAPSVVPKPTIVISPLPVTTKVPPPVTICDYAAPPNGCWYVKGTNYNTTTQCGMELKCNGVLPPVKITISPLPVTTIKPTVTLKPTEGVVKLPPVSPKVTIAISPVPKDTLAPTPNLEMKRLQDQVDTLNKKLEAQSSELKQTNSLLKRMTDYLSNFFKFR